MLSTTILIVAIVVAIWVAVSIPAALLFGKMIRHGSINHRLEIRRMR